MLLVREQLNVAALPKSTVLIAVCDASTSGHGAFISGSSQSAIGAINSRLPRSFAGAAVLHQSLHFLKRGELREQCVLFPLATSCSWAFLRRAHFSSARTSRATL